MRLAAIALLAIASAAAADEARVRTILAQAGEPADDTAPREQEGAPEAPPEGQESPAPPSGVEVIRVVGEELGDIQTDVADSVTLFDAEELKALGAQNVGDLAKATPNLEIKTAGSTAPTFFIRGVGLSDFASNAPGAVAIYQDDVPVNAPALQLGSLFDLEAVAVERGPQGGGSGRNASAGAIRIVSRKPTGELDAYLRSNFGNYALRDFEGALEVPVVEDMLATRFAFRATQRDHLAENRCNDVPSEQLGSNPPPPAFIGQPVPPIAERAASPPTWRRVSFCGESVHASFVDVDTGITYQAPPPPFANAQSALPGGLPGEVNDLGNWAARGALSFTPPGTEMDWLLNGHGSRTDQLSTLGQSIGTRPPPGTFGGVTAQGYRDRDLIHVLDEYMEQGLTEPEALDKLEPRLARNIDLAKPFQNDYNRVGDTTLDTWGTFARGEWAVRNIVLTSITGYDAYDRYRDTDQDFTPDILFESIVKDDAWQVTQELKASGELTDSGAVRWQAGGFTLVEDLHNDTNQLARTVTAGRPRRLLQDYTQDLWSWGAFAGFGWDFLEDFTLDGGVRWNWEKKHFEKSLALQQIPPNANSPPPTFETLSDTWQAPTGTLTLSYRFVEDVSLYWGYSRGWKGGHYSAIPQPNFGVTIADPESVDAFEVGLKGNWFDGRLGLGFEMFYYKYKDYQVFVFEDSPAGPPAINIVNASDAENYGADLDLRVEPLEALVLTARLGWLESKFLDFTNEIRREFTDENNQTSTIVVNVDYTGNRLINSPRLKASGAAEYTFDLGRYGAVIPRYDFAWTDDIYFDPTEGRGSPNVRGDVFLPEYSVGQRAYWIHNARLAYRTADGNIELAGWVRNFTNKVYKTYAFDASSFSGLVVNYVGEPRTYGIEVSFSF